MYYFHNFVKIINNNQRCTIDLNDKSSVSHGAKGEKRSLCLYISEYLQYVNNFKDIDNICLLCNNPTKPIELIFIH